MSWKNQFPQQNRYFETENGILYNQNCAECLKQFPYNCIDLIVTSPPYDNLRTYGKDIDKTWNFEVFKKIANELSRVIKRGGVIVWVVNDATIKGSETGTSFRQALYFKDECKLNLHDTMIYAKNNFSNPSNNRYHQIFEYMFIFSKGKPKTFNPIKDRKNKCVGQSNWGKNTVRQKDGSLKERKKRIVNEYGMRFNIWRYITSGGIGQKDKIAYKHPATFPEQLAYDHIISWSNENDIVLDPFMGSGTVAKQSEKLNRRWIGIELNEEYCKIAKQRIEKSLTC
jgi:DNA modification methylase